MKKLIAPSILSADFSKLGEEVQAVESAGADWIHLDVMDGHFVPNITVGPVVIGCLKGKTKLTLDVHLMITHPDKYIDAFHKAGADIITIHQESESNLKDTIAAIQKLGLKAGISIRPATPVSALDSIIESVDLVLVMTVDPGFGGQKLIDSCVDKIKTLSKIKKDRKLNFIIEADGGINLETINRVSKAGCEVFVAGSAIFKTQDYAKTIKALKEKL